MLKAVVGTVEFEGLPTLRKRVNWSSSEEKRAVADDGSAESSAKLVALDLIAPLVLHQNQNAILRGSSRGKIVPCVEHRVAQEIESIAVKVVCAGLSDHVDHRARILAVLRVVIAGLYAELLQRVRERERRLTLVYSST